MKFTVFTEELKSALPKVVRILPTKASLPILENIYFKVDAGFLTLSCTDLEIGVRLKLVVKSEENGVITVPGRSVNDFVGALSSEKIDFVSKEDSLAVSTDTSKANFVGIDAKEYPEIPSLEQSPLFSLPKSTLTEATNYVSFAASADANRPVLTGVLFVLDENGLTLVATDGYRLSLKTFASQSSQPLSVIVPTRFLVEASRLFSVSEDDTIDFLYDQGRSLAILRNQEVELSSRLIEGQFPNYSAILPTGFSTRAVLSKDELNNALRVVAVFSRESGNIVKMKFTPNQGLSLASNTSQVGSSTVDVTTSVEGEEVDVAFNIRYLNDFLSCCKASQAIVELSGKVKPALFQEMGNDSFKHVIMPVKMQT